jgi:MFS family permease
VRSRITRGLTQDTYLLSFTSLFADVSTEMLYPILPIFVTQVLGASAGTLGAIEGVATATQYLVQGPSGWLSDRLRSRRFLAASGFLAAALAKPLIGSSASWPEALAGRFADRFGTGIRSAPRDAMIASSVAADARGRAFGLESVGDNLGAFIGPLVCALVLFAMHLPLRSVFYLALIPGLASVVFVLLVRERPLPSTSRGDGPRLRGLSADYWKYLVATCVFGLGNATNALLILRAQNIGLSLEATVIVYAGLNLSAAVASLPAGYLSDRFGRKRTLMAALGIFVITYAGFALGTNGVVVAILLLLFGLFQGTFRAIGKALAADLSPESRRGTGLGLYAATVGLTGLFGGVIGGQLWDRLGPAATFWYGSIFGVLGIVTLGLLVNHRRPDRQSP